MSAQKTPLELVNEEHGGKEKLVDKILGSLEAEGDEDKADLKRRLLAASNKKLLRLAETARALKEKYGSKEKLVATVAGALGRAKDSDFVQRLESMTQGRLLDMARALGRRGPMPAPQAKAAAAPKPKVATPKPKAEPKAKAKAAAKPATKAKAAKPAAKKAPAKGKKK
jgi:hypothetical protein